MKLKTLVLSEHDRQQLQHIARRSDDWRERERAQTILYLADGWRTKAIAAEQNLHLDTVYDRRQRWLASGFASLYLPSQGGAPAKLTEDHRTLLHKAKAIQPLLAILKERGLPLYFLPPYSPELNRIEKLWHKMKYQWMAFKARDAQTLESDVNIILEGFGEDYRFDFC